jgi:hypothetical protein
MLTVFTPSCLKESAVHSIYIVLCFSFVFSVSCVPYVAIFYGLSFCDCLFGILQRFYNFYLNYQSKTMSLWLEL